MHKPQAWHLKFTPTRMSFNIRLSKSTRRGCIRLLTSEEIFFRRETSFSKRAYPTMRRYMTHEPRDEIKNHTAKLIQLWNYLLSRYMYRITCLLLVASHSISGCTRHNFQPSSNDFSFGCFGSSEQRHHQTVALEISRAFAKEIKDH